MNLDRRKILAPSIFLYIFLASWSGVFKFHDILTLPMLAVCLLFLNIVLCENLQIRMGNLIVYLSALTIFIFISLLNINGKTLNYVMVYVIFFVCTYFISLYFRIVDVNLVRKYNCYAILFILFVIFSEIFLPIFTGMSIFDYIPRSKENTATIDGFFKRAYGFSTEPTQVANYLVTAGMAAMSVIVRMGAIKITLFIMAYLVSVFLTFSAVASAILAIDIVILSCVWLATLKFRKRMLTTGILIISMLIIAFFISSMFVNMHIVDAGVNKIAMKLALDSSNTSAMQRQELLVLSLNLFMEKPMFGHGLGFMSTNDLMSPINWYLMLLVESGIFGLNAILIMLALLFTNVQISQLPLLMKIALLNGLLYFLFTSTFYSMGFWIALMLATAKGVKNDH